MATGIDERYTFTIEHDEVGGYRCIIEDWYTRAGGGRTVYEAMLNAIENAEDWLNDEESEDESQGDVAAYNAREEFATDDRYSENYRPYNPSSEW